MQQLILVCLSVLSFNNFTSHTTQSSTFESVHEDRVVIGRRRILLVRSPELARQFPKRKTAVVIYPVITGLSNPAVLRRVRSTLDFKNIFDYSLKEYREDDWLTEFTYVVNYNKNYLFDITFTQSGMSAYPDEQSRHFLISLKDGHIVRALDAFHSDKLAKLTFIVDRELQREIKKIANENRDRSEQKEVNGAYENLKFELKALDEFSVGPGGIFFLYDAGFPHAIKALQPQGRYFFTYSALREYIKPDGPLGQFVD